MRIVCLIAALSVSCGDNQVVPPDAFDEGFGNACITTTPTGPCPSRTGIIGWCIVENEADRPNGICRRGCDGGRGCPDGETETMIPIMPNDCYCMP